MTARGHSRAVFFSGRCSTGPLPEPCVGRGRGTPASAWTKERTDLSQISVKSEKPRARGPRGKASGNLPTAQTLAGATCELTNTTTSLAGFTTGRRESTEATADQVCKVTTWLKRLLRCSPKSTALMSAPSAALASEPRRSISWRKQHRLPRGGAPVTQQLR